MNTLALLSDLVERVTSKGGSEFYRKFYAVDENTDSLKVRDWNSWRALPFLSKHDLQVEKIENRVFCDWGDVSSIHASSGTSGRPPHFSPWRRLDGYEYRERFHTFARPALCSMPIHHQHEEFLNDRSVKPRLIVFDPRRARISVELAKLAAVDSLFIFSGHLSLIGAEAERLDMGKQIRFIELAGESCTRALYNYAKRIFPNASIVSFYGATEVENPPISVPCRTFSEQQPLELHHPREGYYIELMDPETRELLPVEPGVEGEIVLSADICVEQPPGVFPLVRYRTGDMATVHEKLCAEHFLWSFTMPGRTEMDFIKIPGGILRADEVERVLRSMGPEVSDYFELQYGEIETNGNLKIRVRLLVDTNVKDIHSLARSIEAKLRVAPTFTYADGVARGMYLPILCEHIPKHRPLGKRRRMQREAA